MNNHQFYPEKVVTIISLSFTLSNILTFLYEYQEEQNHNSPAHSVRIVKFEAKTRCISLIISETDCKNKRLAIARNANGRKLSNFAGRCSCSERAQCGGGGGGKAGERLTTSVFLPPPQSNKE